MKTSKKNGAGPTDGANKEPGHASGCTINIRIKSGGDVNIYNCAAPPAPGAACPPPEEDDSCPPGVPGACVPVSLGAKPKQSRRNKLDKLLAFCAEPRTAVDSFATLFRKPIGESDYGIATGEAVAHLHWLEERGKIRRVTDAGGVDRFVAIQAGQQRLPLT